VLGLSGFPSTVDKISSIAEEIKFSIAETNEQLEDIE